ncbi:glycosyltransferase family 4 protein [Sphingomonas kyeonggiensis]|uniref:Glycosyltransferase involved in cell wall biosynthesis n=1 Tax=Sphingomonas kyeonggiensis TaxID=1268553 RepID=A0A7W6JTL2_9SPHN|nr:glycosyltransferase family 1 protein [Sphingomonas kyeonggiensis]MBB4099285.1 glycosyltransferase involved in cell wall biosynthesis [Sphingomonas kyeonggiensis]
MKPHSFPGQVARADHTPPVRSIEPELILDLTRLLSRVRHPTPTGVDRVELHYARALLARAPERLQFAATHPLGHYGRLDPGAVLRFLDATERRWGEVGGEETGGAGMRHLLVALASLRPQRIEPTTRPRIVLHVSPSALEKPGKIAARLRRENARLICLVHDLIPIAEPGFARADGSLRHQRRMIGVARHAHGVIANSQATADALARHLDAIAEPVPPLLVNPLGTAPLASDAPGPPPIDGPYFLCLGTIEPRKNHLLLLHLWRRLAEAADGSRIPRLVLIGRRGWENQNTFNLLDRCPQLRPHVLEVGRVSDRTLSAWLGGSSALLMPSFAEGFGLPVAEALAAGIPVIASDLPAHREAGGAVPDYLDPLDGPGWHRSILDYAAPASSARSAQLARMRGSSRRTWEDHVERTLAFAEEVARS